MRGSFDDQGHLFSYMTLEERVPTGIRYERCAI